MSVPSDLQPSCRACKKPYPLNNIHEWKNWGYIEFRKIAIKEGRGKEFQLIWFCGECLKKVKVTY